MEGQEVQKMMPLENGYYWALDKLYRLYKIAVENVGRSICDYTRLHRYSPGCAISHKEKERLVFEYETEARIIWSLISDMLCWAEVVAEGVEELEIAREKTKEYRPIKMDISRLDDLEDLEEKHGKAVQ